MRLRNDIDITKFMEEIKHCSGAVYYRTAEGDLLNLSSTLSQFIFFSIVPQPHYFSTGEVTCDDPDDYELLHNYLF